MKPALVVRVLIALVLFSPTFGFAQQPVTLDQLSRVVASAWQSWQGVKDYNCIFYKQELVKGKLREKETIRLKFRKAPYSVYMNWTDEPYQGRETLFVAGKNNNEIKVHEGGVIGLINADLHPRCDRAMKGNRHTIQEIAIGRTIELVKDDLQLARSRNEGAFMDIGLKNYEGLTAHCFRAVFPESGVKPVSTCHPVQGKYYAADITICIDDRANLPVVVENRSASGQLIEYYVYQNLKINTGLTDKDFSPDNKEYGY